MDKKENDSELTNSSNWRNIYHANAYVLLLLVLMALLGTCAALSGTHPGLIASDVLLFIVILVIASTNFRKERGMFFAFTISAFLSGALDVIALFCEKALSEALECTAGFGYLGLLLASIILLIKKLSTARRITLDTVFGGICVYFLIAFVWYVMYAMLEQVDSTAFRYAFTRKGEYDLMYFSLNTVTTLGHGDIVPISRLAMVLCNLEAMIGQIFPAVYIARLVSLYVIHELDERNKRDAEKAMSVQTDS